MSSRLGYEGEVESQLNLVKKRSYMKAISFMEAMSFSFLFVTAVNAEIMLTGSKVHIGDVDKPIELVRTHQTLSKMKLSYNATFTERRCLERLISGPVYRPDSCDPFGNCRPGYYEPSEPLCLRYAAPVEKMIVKTTKVDFRKSKKLLPGQREVFKVRIFVDKKDGKGEWDHVAVYGVDSIGYHGDGNITRTEYPLEFVYREVGTAVTELPNTVAVARGKDYNGLRNYFLFQMKDGLITLKNPGWKWNGDCVPSIMPEDYTIQEFTAYVSEGSVKCGHTIAKMTDHDLKQKVLQNYLNTKSDYGWFRALASLTEEEYSLRNAQELTQLERFNLQKEKKELTTYIAQSGGDETTAKRLKKIDMELSRMSIRESGVKKVELAVDEFLDVLNRPNFVMMNSGLMWLVLNNDNNNWFQRESL